MLWRTQPSYYSLATKSRVPLLGNFDLHVEIQPAVPSKISKYEQSET